MVHRWKGRIPKKLLYGWLPPLSVELVEIPLKEDYRKMHKNKCESSCLRDCVETSAMPFNYETLNSIVQLLHTLRGNGILTIKVVALLIPKDQLRLCHLLEPGQRSVMTMSPV